ncbi:MAG: hypothetical protein AAF556_07565 [Pseudomonadota bacterium]
MSKKKTKESSNRINRARNGFVVRVIVVGITLFAVVQTLIYVFTDDRTSDEIALRDLANR